MKHEIVNLLSISKDALHVHVGLAVFLLVAAVARKGLRSSVPLIAVIIVALAGELLDARADFRKLGHWRYMASLHDFLNTVLWPVALWLLARYSRVLR